LTKITSSKKNFDECIEIIHFLPMVFKTPKACGGPKVLRIKKTDYGVVRGCVSLN
jgi:hypothetical protein